MQSATTLKNGPFKKICKGAPATLSDEESTTFNDTWAAKKEIYSRPRKIFSQARSGDPFYLSAARSIDRSALKNDAAIFIRGAKCRRFEIHLVQIPFYSPRKRHKQVNGRSSEKRPFFIHLHRCKFQSKKQFVKIPFRKGDKELVRRKKREP